MDYNSFLKELRIETVASIRKAYLETYYNSFLKELRIETAEEWLEIEKIVITIPFLRS